MPPKGYKLSEAAKAKISASKLGKPSWNKGVPQSEAAKQKMSVAKIGKVMTDEFREKRRKIMLENWADPKYREEIIEQRKGIPRPPMSQEQKDILKFYANNRSDEWRLKQSQSHIGNIPTQETREKMSITHRGEKCHNWKGGITSLNINLRNIRRSKIICAEKLKEQDYTDIFTHVRGGVLACHHIIPQNVIITMYNITTMEQAWGCEALFDKHNLIVMLASAHDKFHNIYGDEKNIFELTKEQIEELYT